MLIYTRFFSPNIMFLMFIYVAAHTSSLVICIASGILLYKYNAIFLCIHLLMGTAGFFFQFLANINRDTINIPVQHVLRTYVFISLR